MGLRIVSVAVSGSTIEPKIQTHRSADGEARFRDIKTLQKFAAVHASIHNHFNQERHLYNCENFKLNRYAALAEWRQLAA